MVFPQRYLSACLGLFVSVSGARGEGAPEIAPELQPFVDRHELAGAVMLSESREKVLAVETVGFADIAAKKPMTAETLFWIASQSKSITAVAVLMLVDEGKIALDDPVEKFLHEFRGQLMIAEKDDAHQVLRKPAHPITIREVLSHTSGLPFKSAAEEPTLDGLPLASSVRTYAMTPLQSEPGTKFSYSNAGINTAARVLEVVAKMPYETFLQQRLLEPLGMKDSTFWPNDEQLSRLAKSYRPGKAGGLEELQIGQLIYPLSDRVHRFPMPAGGLFSTAHDVGRFCQMLLNGGELDGRRYLSPQMFGELTKRQTAPSITENYGFGLTTNPDNFGHGGAYSTGMDVFPGKDLAMIWMVQHAGFPGEGAKTHELYKKWAIQRFGK